LNSHLNILVIGKVIVALKLWNCIQKVLGLDFGMIVLIVSNFELRQPEEKFKTNHDGLFPNP